MKKIILIVIASKRIKYLGINLIKEAKYLYTKNYKILVTEIKDSRKWKHPVLMD